MAIAIQELQQLLASPILRLWAKRHPSAPKPIEEILAELDTPGVENTETYKRSEKYKSFLNNLRNYYHERLLVIHNLQMFHQMQHHLEERYTLILKTTESISPRDHHPTDKLEPKLPLVENQSLWERLKNLAQEIAELEKRWQEAEQENQTLEKQIQQHEAIQRLTDKTRPQTHTQQIKDFATLYQQGEHTLKPSLVKKFEDNTEAEKQRFSKTSAELTKINQKIVTNLKTIETTQPLINEKYEEYQTSYKFLPKPTLKPAPAPAAKKTDEEKMEKVYGKQKWHTQGKAQAEKSALNNLEMAADVTSFKPSFGRKC